MHRIIVLSLFITAMLVSTGCTVVHTVPLAGRLGDTIFVTVGSPDNEMTAANTDLTYTPTGGSAIPIPDTAILSVFNLYPSKMSSAWLYSDADTTEINSGHGPWTTVMAVSLPNDGTLPVGTGTLQVNTTASYSAPLPSPNGFDITLEILPGTGQASSFDHLGFGQTVLTGQLAELESMKRLQFKPDYTGYDGTNTYGAVEVKIGIDKIGITGEDYNIIFDEKIGTTQSRNVSFMASAKKLETTVYIISPKGNLQYSDVNFSIISKELQRRFEASEQSVSSITVNTTWYDIDGNVVVTAPPVNLVNLTGT